MASSVANFFTYVRVPDAADDFLVELGCVSSESMSHTPQTSNLPTCRKNNTIRKRVDGIESAANFQLEYIDAEDLFLFRFFRRAALLCEELELFFLDAAADAVDVDGDVFLGVVGATWTRNNGETNMAVTVENTGVITLFEDWVTANTPFTINSTPITAWPSTVLPDPSGNTVAATTPEDLLNDESTEVVAVLTPGEEDVEEEEELFETESEREDSE